MRGPSIQLDADDRFGLSPVKSIPARPRRGSAAIYARGVRSSVELDLRSPIKLLVFAVVLMAIDWGYTVSTGEVVRLGPARMFWLAGPIAAIGAVQLFSRLLAHGD